MFRPSEMKVLARPRITDGAASDVHRQVFPLNEFHREKADGGRGVRFARVVDVRNVRMIERGERFSLAREAGQPVRVGGEDVRQDLEGHIALIPSRDAPA